MGTCAHACCDLNNLDSDDVAIYCMLPTAKATISLYMSCGTRLVPRRRFNARNELCVAKSYSDNVAKMQVMCWMLPKVKATIKLYPVAHDWNPSVVSLRRCRYMQVMCCMLPTAKATMSLKSMRPARKLYVRNGLAFRTDMQSRAPLTQLQTT